MSDFGLPYHPAAAIFPLMDGIELQALVEDITAHGLLEEIVTLDEKVLDGRNRLRACEIAGVTPRFVEWAEDGASPTEWVVSKNLHRRHLTTAQRAALALDLLPRLEEEAKERQRLAAQTTNEKLGRSHETLSPDTDEASGRSDEKAAALVGVGRTAVADVKTIQKRDPTGEVIDDMRAGALNIAQAKRQVGLASNTPYEGVMDNGERTIHGRIKPIMFGKGDKFHEATEPLARYLKAWAKQDMKFTHVNPREAGKRITKLDELTALITTARADLEPRSVRAKLTL